MEKIIWPTTSVWFDETLELFKNINAEDNPVSIAKKVKDGDVFGDMKETTTFETSKWYYRFQHKKS